MRVKRNKATDREEVLIWKIKTHISIYVHTCTWKKCWFGCHIPKCSRCYVKNWTYGEKERAKCDVSRLKNGRRWFPAPANVTIFGSPCLCHLFFSFQLIIRLFCLPACHLLKSSNFIQGGTSHYAMLHEGREEETAVSFLILHTEKVAALQCCWLDGLWSWSSTARTDICCNHKAQKSLSWVIFRAAPSL